MVNHEVYNVNQEIQGNKENFIWLALCMSLFNFSFCSSAVLMKTDV